MSTIVLLILNTDVFGKVVLFLCVYMFTTKFTDQNPLILQLLCFHCRYTYDVYDDLDCLSISYRVKGVDVVFFNVIYSLK